MRIYSLLTLFFLVVRFLLNRPCVIRKTKGCVRTDVRHAHGHAAVAVHACAELLDSIRTRGALDVTAH